jgi:site-specific recombinase XerD
MSGLPTSLDADQSVHAMRQPGSPGMVKILFSGHAALPETPASVARFLKSLYADAGISGASSHSGRRTLTTRLAERGIDLKAIVEIAGHTSIRTTTIYVESNPKRLACILQDVTF